MAHSLTILLLLLLLLLLLSDLGNARVIIEAVLLIETITPMKILLYYWYIYRILFISLIS